ncbi:MAG TPA: flagellar basal body-associated FliL family protein [Acetobacteraceae bacterium]|jgi:flagellar protein FliL|nr:flagellar basal body-associated FliL family protein [Acetobacteraceae bacterium]
MNAATATPDKTETENEAAPPMPSGRRKLLLLAGPLALAGLLAGLWFSGMLPRWLGLSHPHATEAQAATPQPIYIDLPEMIANLNGNPRRPSYIKLDARIEVASQQDADRIRQAMPRLQDLFLTYMREMRPDELRGSAGLYRLREELIARADAAAAPVRITDVLFTQMLIQ